MNSLDFMFAGHRLTATGAGALWWSAERLLAVSDLHLGRAERRARLGGALLPPYEIDETLDRLEAEIRRLGPRLVVCLGDSFDDDAATGALSPAQHERLLSLQSARRWVWVAGNHDPAAAAPGGLALEEMALEGLTFRHVARPAARGEVSGHYHPRAAVRTRGGTVARRCFLFDRARLILPAFGTYTGGLRTDDPALAGLMEPEAEAILTGPSPLRLPMPRGARSRQVGNGAGERRRGAHA